MKRATVVIELAGDPATVRDLAAGGVFVPGLALQLSEECDLVVRGQAHQLVVPARVVYRDELRGAGLELVGFSPELKARLAELAPDAPHIEVVDVPAGDDGALLGDAPIADDELSIGGPPESAPLIDLQAIDDAGDDDLAVPIEGAGEPGAAGELDPAGEPLDDDLALAIAAERDPGGPVFAALTTAPTLPPEGAAPHQPDEPDAHDEAGAHEPHDDVEDAAATEADHALRKIARNVHERLRGLTLTAQHKMASSGELHERIVLERMYGKNVWETLLRNPRLTPPEVARIARYGSLPRVLLEIIVGNNTWLQVPEVRRALLSNARLGTDQIMKVLRLLPRHELRLAAIQTAYPFAVRNAARQLMRTGGAP
ncbi:MAG TPA: hypothetical protein VFK02_00195 [Kofleriaceae bacterium]|nr:hypothetical protein [Kofleriaceae bacterium]